MVKLNKIEKLKEQLLPINYDINSVDFNNLSEADRFYLKNFGIYNINLRPNIFMLRLRINGGLIDISSLELILKIAKEYDLELIITSRAALELHNIKPNDILKIYKKINSSSLTTHQTLTDNFRNFTTTPFDGIGIYNKIYAGPILEQIQNEILNNPLWFGIIPRKFNIAICGDLYTNLSFFNNDIFFALAKKDEIFGFNVYVGGKNSEAAKDLNIFVEPNEVKDIFLAIATVFKQKGSRGTRAKTRLFHLIQNLGLDNFRKEVLKIYNKKVKTKGEFLIKKGFSLKLKDGTYAKEIKTNFGKIDLITLKNAIDLAKKENLKIKLSINQKLYLLGSKEPFDSALNITACAGSKYCPLSLWDIKQDTLNLPLERFKKLNISVGFSGCLKGCGKHHHYDIGLIGLRTNIYKETEKGARVFLGAIYTKNNAKASRMVFSIVPLRELNNLLNLILDEFENSYFSDFEDFANLLNSYSEGFLMVWFISKYIYKFNFLLNKSEQELFKKLKSLPNFPQIDEEGYYKTVEILKHRAWDKDIGDGE